MGSLSRVLMAVLRLSFCPVLSAHRSGVHDELWKVMVTTIRHALSWMVFPLVTNLVMAKANLTSPFFWVMAEMEKLYNRT